MKSNIYKKLILIFIFSIIGLINPPSSYANAPDVSGLVIAAYSNAPVPGVIVDWQDNRGQHRQTVTDGNGSFFFVSCQNSGTCSGFGCREGPHIWRVTSFADGTCTTISRGFDNIGASLGIGTITCILTPPPTSTPTPNPTVWWNYNGPNGQAVGTVPPYISPTSNPVSAQSVSSPTPSPTYFIPQVEYNMELPAVNSNPPFFGIKLGQFITPIPTPSPKP